MNSTRQLCAVLILVLMFSATLIAADPPTMKLRVSLDQANHLPTLRQMGFDGLYVTEGYVDLFAEAEGLGRIRQAGIPVEVLHEDVATYYAEQLAEYDGMGGYKTFTEVVAYLDGMIAEHGGIMTDKISVGQSIEGRDIWAVKISDNPEIDEDEPEIFFNSLIHANEPATVELLLYFMDYLTDNYGSIPQITHLVDDLETWIIPMMNPDGRTAGTRVNANGVDLNRDYGYMWDYVTPDIFSQPETRVIREHGLRNNFSISLSYHTSGDIVNYVWNYKDFPVADSAFIVDISEEYGSYNGYWVVEGYNWYQTLGDCNDWSYGSRWC